MRRAWVQILLLPLIKCVTLSIKCVTSLGFSFFMCRMETITLTSQEDPSPAVFYSTKPRACGLLVPRVGAVSQLAAITWTCSLLGGH